MGKEQPIRAVEADHDFRSEIIKRSGVNLNLCWHCKCCSGGCPFSWAMDLFPNHVIRMVQLGLKREALTCSTIWICVGCHTCSVQCPMAIDLAAVMDALREVALEEKVNVPESDILNFHREVLNSIERYGRTHKLEIMLRYKLQKRDWLQDVDVGLKMLAKRKLDLKPSKVADVQRVKQFFKKKGSG